MLKTDLIQTLKAKLQNERSSGKHAMYQSLPPILKNALGENDYEAGLRFEQARFDFITSQVALKDKSVLDIGCNLGFFTFSALAAGACKIKSFEGNEEHADFVAKSVTVLSADEIISIENSYYQFSSEKNKYDVGFILNVLHHVGDDYGDQALTQEHACDVILSQLNKTSYFCDYLVFQLGFNWRGNKHYPLFTQGTKKEMIDFITQGTQGHWMVESIGVAVRKMDGDIKFDLLSESNIPRDDSLGEFLNRPIFILKSVSA